MRARWTLLAAALLLAAGAAAFGYRHAGGGTSTTGQPPAYPQVLAAGTPVVGPGTIVRYRRFYEGCGEEQDGAGPAPLGLYGMTREQVQRAFPDARILRFDPELVELYTAAPGCPYRSLTLTLRDGVVVAYYGTPGNLGPVYRVTGIRAAGLPPGDRDRLATGIVVNEPQEVDQLIEGLGD